MLRSAVANASSCEQMSSVEMVLPKREMSSHATTAPHGPDVRMERLRCSGAEPPRRHTVKASRTVFSGSESGDGGVVCCHSMDRIDLEVHACNARNPLAEASARVNPPPGETWQHLSPPEPNTIIASSRLRHDRREYKIRRTLEQCH
jgi:hypothetical protein